MIALEQIRAARAMLNLKQHELAKKAGISTGTLNNIERGVQTDPKLSTLRAIKRALEAEDYRLCETLQVSRNQLEIAMRLLIGLSYKELKFDSLDFDIQWTKPMPKVAHWQKNA